MVRARVLRQKAAHKERVAARRDLYLYKMRRCAAEMRLVAENFERWIEIQLRSCRTYAVDGVRQKRHQLRTAQSLPVRRVLDMVAAQCVQ